MLNNPNWDNKVTLANFIAFLETKPADEAYEYYSPVRCACAQFGDWLGIPRLQERQEIWGTGGVSDLNDIARGPVIVDDASGKITLDAAGWTFGACLERAKRAMISE